MEKYPWLRISKKKNQEESWESKKNEILESIASKDLPNKVLLIRDLKEMEKSHMDIWKKSISGRRNGIFKALKVGTHWRLKKTKRCQCKNGEKTRN